MKPKRKAKPKPRASAGCRGCDAKDREIARMRDDLEALRDRVELLLLEGRGKPAGASVLDSVSERAEEPPAPGAVKIGDVTAAYRRVHGDGYEGELEGVLSEYGA